MSKQYSSEQIVELEFLDAVRRRPGMYIGNNNLHGLHHILLEVLDNAVDECMAGYASKITVTLDKDGTVEITDDGRGIPVEYKAESGMSTLTQVLVKPHAGGKFWRRYIRLQQFRWFARDRFEMHQCLFQFSLRWKYTVTA